MRHLESHAPRAARRVANSVSVILSATHEPYAYDSMPNLTAYMTDRATANLRQLDHNTLQQDINGGIERG